MRLHTNPSTSISDDLSYEENCEESFLDNKNKDKNLQDQRNRLVNERSETGDPHQSLQHTSSQVPNEIDQGNADSLDMDSTDSSHKLLPVGQTAKTTSVNYSHLPSKGQKLEASDANDTSPLLHSVILPNKSLVSPNDTSSKNGSRMSDPADSYAQNHVQVRPRSRSSEPLKLQVL